MAEKVLPLLLVTSCSVKGGNRLIGMKTLSIGIQSWYAWLDNGAKCMHSFILLLVLSPATLLSVFIFKTRAKLDTCTVVILNRTSVKNNVKMNTFECYIWRYMICLTQGICHFKCLKWTLPRLKNRAFSIGRQFSRTPVFGGQPGKARPSPTWFGIIFAFVLLISPLGLVFFTRETIGLSNISIRTQSCLQRRNLVG